MVKKPAIRMAAAALAACAALVMALSAQAGTLEDVRARGTLNCGVSTGLIGFSARDANGQWSGFDVDFCRAVAAAVLNDPAKVTYVPLTAAERSARSPDKRIDLPLAQLHWNLEREAG